MLTNKAIFAAISLLALSTTGFDSVATSQNDSAPILPINSHGEMIRPTAPLVEVDSTLSRISFINAARPQSSAVVPTKPVYSPSKCTGYTYLPHKSGNIASVHGRITCSNNVQYLKTVTSLYRETPYGFQPLASDGSETTGKNTSNDAHPHQSCSGTGTHTYWGFSAHFTTENGKNYFARTGNGGNNQISRFSC